MLLPRYELKSDESLTVFEFLSIGKRGEIPKIVQYSETNLKDFYNLGFGDKDPHTGFISDLTVTNNNDSRKVLNTVAATLYAFTDTHLNATVIATGSTEARTRLYRMGITNNLEGIEQDFEVLGLNENIEWEPFRKNVPYGAFLVRRKM